MGCVTSLERKIEDLKIIKTARGLSSFSFRYGVKIVKTVQISQCGKFTRTLSILSGCLDKIGREYGLQPEIFKGLINHSEITKYNCKVLRHNGKPYLESDVLLAFIYARHAMVMQKITMIGIKETIT